MPDKPLRPITWDNDLMVVDAAITVQEFQDLTRRRFFNWYVLRLQEKDGPLFFALTADEMRYHNGKLEDSLTKVKYLEKRWASRLLVEGMELPERGPYNAAAMSAVRFVVLLKADLQPYLVGDPMPPEPVMPEAFDMDVGQPPAPEPPMAAKKLQKNSLIRIFYGTDRARDEFDEEYIGERAKPERLQLGLCDVEVPWNHEIGDLETDSRWKKIKRVIFRSDEPVFAVRQTKVLEADAFYGFLKARLEDVSAKDLFVFIHGFRVHFNDACLRTAQIAMDLKLKNAPVLYSWSSAGDTAGYFGDEESVRMSKVHFLQFLRDLKAKAGPARIHLIAHSMGNRLVVDSLSDLQLTGELAGLQLDQLVLAAPDIPQGLFRQVAESVWKGAKRVTMYASDKDVALGLSQMAHNGFTRAGDAGDLTIVSGVDTIDASVIDTSFLNHSYFGERYVASDIFYLLSANSPPDARFGIGARSHKDGKYWAIL